MFKLIKENKPAALLLAALVIMAAAMGVGKVADGIPDDGLDPFYGKMECAINNSDLEIVKMVETEYGEAYDVWYKVPFKKGGYAYLRKRVVFTTNGGEYRIKSAVANGSRSPGAFE